MGNFTLFRAHLTKYVTKSRSGHRAKAFSINSTSFSSKYFTGGLLSQLFLYVILIGNDCSYRQVVKSDRYILCRHDQPPNQEGCCSHYSILITTQYASTPVFGARVSC